MHAVTIKGPHKVSYPQKFLEDLLSSALLLSAYLSKAFLCIFREQMGGDTRDTSTSKETSALFTKKKIKTEN